MRWMWTRAGTTAVEMGVEPDAPSLDRAAIKRELDARGVPIELCDLLSQRIEARGSEGTEQSRRVLLDGIALAFGVQQEVTGELSRNLRGLREVERLMGSFSGELSKLDEVLEVLAAYVRRMRSTKPEEPRRVLH